MQKNPSQTQPAKHFSSSAATLSWLPWWAGAKCLNSGRLRPVRSRQETKQGPWEQVPVPGCQPVLVLLPDLLVSKRASLSRLHRRHQGGDRSRSQPGETKQKSLLINCWVCWGWPRLCYHLAFISAKPCNME